MATAGILLSMRKAILFLALNLSLFAQAAHQVTLTFSDTSSNPPGTTYNVYRSTGACPSTPPTTTAAFMLLTAQPITVSPYVDTTVAAGTGYCYVMTSFISPTLSGNGPLTSVPSNVAFAQVPANGGVTVAIPPTINGAVAK